MSTSQISAKAIFLQALELTSATERAAYVETQCGSNVDLRHEVEALLAEHQQLGSFMEAPPAPATLDRPVTERPGTQIGPYKILQQIGEGGMGTVFMAEQTEPMQRRVALKIIKLGMDSRQVIARFAAEKQALALMDHVNIARVLDAGVTEQGRPYFVMELVHGVPITKYCDDNHLTPRQRLELFVPVCQAIQHAHQKGIIHRDIKPSNVMITLYDGKPVPKVIDFGVAKAMDQKLTEQTLFTQYGTMVGTLEYMSPEQAEMSALGIDTRSDIYSLGVLLYELLTGSTPLSRKQMNEAAYGEILRLIREEEPPKPSTRLSDSGEALASISAQRHTEPAKLSKLMRGELDWIVMKTLEKDRNRRYETASSFANDVQRYLNDEQVQACPPSVGYRLRKFARRNKRPVLAASVILLALVAGIIGTTWGMLSATVAKAEAVHEAGEKTRALTEKEAALATAKVNEIRATAAQKDAQENLKDALAAVDQMLTRVGEERLANVPQMEPIRRDLLVDALKFYQKFLEKQSDDPVIRREAARAYRRVGIFQNHLGQPAEAEKAYRSAIALFEELGAASPLEPALRVELVNTHIEFSWVLGEGVWKGDEPVQQLRRAVEVGEKLVKDFPDVPDYRIALINARNVLAAPLTYRQPDEAEKILRRNLTLAETDFELQGVHHALGYVFRDTGRLPEAEGAYRQALKHAEKMAAAAPADNWLQSGLAANLRLLAGVLVRNQRPSEAEEYQVRALVIQDKLATDFPAGPQFRRGLAQAQAEHAGVLKQLGRTAEAEKAYRRAVDLYEKLAADFPSLPTYQQMAFDQRLGLGQFLVEAGRTEDAVDVYRQVIDRPGKLAGDVPAKLNHWRGLVRSHVELGRLLAKNGKKEEAEGAYRRAVEIQEKLEKDFAGKPEDRRELAQSHYEAATLFCDAGRLKEAERLYELWRPHSGPELERLKKAVEAEPINVHRWHDLGVTHLRAGDAQAAVDVLEKHGTSAWQWFYIAMAHWQLNHKEEAHSWYYQSIDWIERAQENELFAVQAEAAALMDLPDPGERCKQAWTYSQTGTALEKAGQKDKAKEAYNKAIDLYEKLLVDYPAVPVYRTKLLDLLNKTGRGKEVERVNREAISHLEKLAAAHPKMTRHRQAIGELYTELGQWDKAAAEYTKAIELKPDDWWAWSGRAFVHFRRQEWDEAVDDFSKAIELAPHVHTNWWHRGHAYRALAQWDKSAADFGKAVEGWPDGAEGWYWRGVAFAQLNEPDKALADLRQAIAKGFNAPGRIKNDPQLAPLCSHDGFKTLLDEVEKKEKKRLDDAVAAFRKAIELDANDAPAHAELGAALRAQGNLDEAIACYRKTIELDPKQANAHTALGNALKAQGKSDEAIAAYRQAIEHDTNPRAVHTNLAWWLATDANPKVRDPKAAATHARKAIDLAPEDPNHWSNLGVALWRAGDLKTAVETLEKADRMYQDGDHFHRFFLAMAYWQIGEKDKARKAYDQAVEWMDKRQPEHEELRRFRAEAEELLGVSQKKM